MQLIQQFGGHLDPLISPPKELCSLDSILVVVANASTPTCAQASNYAALDGLPDASVLDSAL